MVASLAPRGVRLRHGVSKRTEYALIAAALVLFVAATIGQCVLR